MKDIESMSDLAWWNPGIKIYRESRCGYCEYGNGMKSPFDREGRCRKCNSLNNRDRFFRIVVRR